MVKVSAVILSKNEVDRIARCINSLYDIVDEVILVDSGSTDGTVEIANRLGAKVFKTKWKGYGETKNYGHIQAQNDWILSIDSDEWLSKDLALEIRMLKPENKRIYAVNRSNLYMGKKIRHSGWSPDWVLRFFNKNDVVWNDNLVHEKLIIPKGHKIQKLRGELMHASYRSLDDHKAKTDIYAKLKAESWIRSESPPSFMKRYFGFGFKAFHSYILKLGSLDGKEGKIIAKMNAYLVKRQIEYYDHLKPKGK